MTAPLRRISPRRARAVYEAAHLQTLIDENAARLAELDAERECKWCVPETVDPGHPLAEITGKTQRRILDLAGIDWHTITETPIHDQPVRESQAPTRRSWLRSVFTRGRAL